MTTRRHRLLALATGATAATASVGASLIGFAATANAVPNLTACSTTSAAASDATVTAQLNGANAAKLVAYKKTAKYKALHAATVAKTAAWKKKKNATTLAAKKKSIAAEAAAIAAYKKANYTTSFSYSYQPSGIDPTGSAALPGAWQWGKYTTRIYVKAGKVVAGGVCNAVNESAPYVTNNTADAATQLAAYNTANPSSSWETFSLSVQDMVLRGVSLDSKGMIGTAAIGGTKAQINTRLNTEVVNVFGSTLPTGAGTTASYSIQGFYNSLQGALIKAKV
ncbi:MAG: hypothetical protein WCP26_11000 [Actinomycetes bacterium]